MFQTQSRCPNPVRVCLCTGQGRSTIRAHPQRDPGSGGDDNARALVLHSSGMTMQGPFFVSALVFGGPGRVGGIPPRLAWSWLQSEASD